MARHRAGADRAYATETVALPRRSWDGQPPRSVLLPYDMVVRS